MGAKRTLIEQAPPGATLKPVHVSDDLKKSSGSVPPKSARRTRSMSWPAFVTLSVANALIVPIPRCPKSATSPENWASGQGVVLSSTDTVFVAVPEFAATKSGLPSSSKSPTAAALGPSPVAHGPSKFVEVRPPSSSPWKTRAVPAVSGPPAKSGVGAAARRSP